MNIASDIQKFRELFALWLEAAATPRQERRLSQLAAGLAGKTGDPALEKDIALILTLDSMGEASVQADPELQPEQFAAFVEETVQATPTRRRHRFALWSAIGAATASAAAVLLLVISGPGSQPADTPGPTAAATPAMAVASKPQPEAPQPAPRPETQPAPRRSDRPARAARPAPALSPAASTPALEEQTLQVREVTDPQEAALIISESCNLLASCISRAGEDTRQAISTVNENINSIYSEI